MMWDTVYVVSSGVAPRNWVSAQKEPPEGRLELMGMPFSTELLMKVLDLDYVGYAIDGIVGMDFYRLLKVREV